MNNINLLRNHVMYNGLYFSRQATTKNQDKEIKHLIKKEQKGGKKIKIGLQGRKAG